MAWWEGYGMGISVLLVGSFLSDFGHLNDFLSKFGLLKVFFLHHKSFFQNIDKNFFYAENKRKGRKKGKKEVNYNAMQYKYSIKHNLYMISVGIR